jgi:hypothetical protein
MREACSDKSLTMVGWQLYFTLNMQQQQSHAPTACRSSTHQDPSCLNVALLPLVRV